jgi:uroporphyrin-III C-methyltransferase/precorrin-2 dehydrogenase/sirohydrochlorin ferrochelatase
LTTSTDRAALLPAFLKLDGRPVLLVGGGRIASTKLGPLLEAGARVLVVAPHVSTAIEAAPVAIRRRRFEPSDLDGAWFVVSAAPRDVNRAVAAAAAPRRIFVNAVDDVEHASAYAGAIVRRSDVTIAIGTGGDAPALAGLLREAIDALLPRDLDRWMKTARELREEWRAESIPMEERRPRLLRALVSLYERPTATGAR